MREMRRKDRTLPMDSTKEILQTAEYGILSTVDEYNNPYGVPMNFSYDGKSIYLHCSLEGHKIDNLLNNSNVCFTVVGPTEVIPDKFTTKYSSVIIFGKISIVADKENKMYGAMELIKKYSPDFISEGSTYINAAFNKVNILKIDIMKITGKGRS